MQRPLILGVEDNKLQQKILLLLAERFGYDISLANSCIEATNAIKGSLRAFDLILMDWRLGDGEDGLACTKHIRDLDAQEGKRTPIIGCTASVMSGDKEECLAAGMDDVLGKPYTMEEFDEMLQKWLSATKSKNVVPFRPLRPCDSTL